MDYIAAKPTVSKNLGKSQLIKAAEQLHTGTITWMLVKRHKGGLLLTWAIIMTALVMVPQLPQIILSII